MNKVLRISVHDANGQKERCIVMICVQREIKNILSKSEEKETALRELAQKLGCSLSSTYIDGKHDEAEMIRRIQEAARSIRESRLWLIAFGALIASILSALAAWFAVLRY